MNSENWIAYYQKNTGSFIEPDWSQPCSMPEGPARHALAESLAVFQVGETGDGSTLQKWAGQESARDPRLRGYPAAVRFFILEENSHADLLAKMVRHLGGTLKKGHWAAWAFNRIRKVIPCLEYEIQILLSAELIARAYYSLLAQYVPEPSIRACCVRLVRDEIKHIAFHAEFFRERFETWSPMAVALWKAQFKLLFSLAAALVWQDHRSMFKSLDITKSLYRSRRQSSHENFLRQVDGVPGTRASKGAQPALPARRTAGNPTPNPQTDRTAQRTAR